MHQFQALIWGIQTQCAMTSQTIGFQWIQGKNTPCTTTTRDTGAEIYSMWQNNTEPCVFMVFWLRLFLQKYIWNDFCPLVPRLTCNCPKSVSLLWLSPNLLRIFTTTLIWGPSSNVHPTPLNHAFMMHSKDTVYVTLLPAALSWVYISRILSWAEQTTAFSLSQPHHLCCQAAAMCYFPV